jgi:ABC-type antimicrobial peptide transport system permease subunit
MIQHYFKVSFRNLWKYKSQTLISVIGLAVGFTCFALATLWIRYEMTFDSFHKNANRIYCLGKPDILDPNILQKWMPYPMAAYLKEKFPEIVRSVSVYQETYPDSKIIIENNDHTVDLLRIDSSFLSFFDVKIIEGSVDFMLRDSKKMAVTREKARQLFGDENPIGKTLKLHGETEYTICAIVTGLSKHSNYPFDFLCALDIENSWHISRGNTLIELAAFTDVEMFRKKLSEHVIEIGSDDAIRKMQIMPLTTMHYEDTGAQKNIQFHYIIIFAVTGSLVILCTLFNYLTLFISRFRIRQREFALRMLFGASGRSLLSLLSVEFGLSLVAALLSGLFLIDMIFPFFRTLSELRMESASIYLESGIYIIGIILISLLIFLLSLLILRRKALSASIGKSHKNMFRKISVITQLIISIGFAFSAIVIVKQMYYLHNTDLGFSFENTGTVVDMSGQRTDVSILHDKIKQIPEITESIREFNPLIPSGGNFVFHLVKWEDKPDNVESTDVILQHVSDEIISYYKLQLMQGEMLNDKDDNKYVMINEAAAKSFGWDNPVGKTINMPVGYFVVKGVLKNVHNLAPTIQPKPHLYTLSMIMNMKVSTVLFKFKDGTWKTCKDKIEKIIETEYPGHNHFVISNAEKEYDKLFLKSENTLLKILMFVALVCVIICVFGFVSLVSLTCEERRKEIAIRKINGATIKDILDLFFREYLVLLVVGAVIAFPLGYLVMKRWLEDYVLQTPISAWIYAAILLMLIMSIILCVGWKVYKTSTENPAEVIKN